MLRPALYLVPLWTAPALPIEHRGSAFDTLHADPDETGSEDGIADSALRWYGEYATYLDSRAGATARGDSVFPRGILGGSLGEHARDSAIRMDARRRDQDGRQLPWSIKLIGAGFQRTGTQSTKMALRMLGFSPSHGEDVTFNVSQVRIWNEAIRGGNLHAALGTLEQSRFDATLDSPYRILWRPFMERFPEAKVLLTVHPQGARGWVRSIVHGTDTIRTLGYKTNPFWNETAEVYHPEPCLRLVLYVRDGVGRDAARVKDYERACMQAYDRHNEEVQRIVPPTRLLVFNVSQGWKPLCKFLGLPVPMSRIFKIVGMELPKKFPHDDVMHSVDWLVKTGVIPASKLPSFAQPGHELESSMHNDTIEALSRPNVTEMPGPSQAEAKLFKSIAQNFKKLARDVGTE